MFHHHKGKSWTKTIHSPFLLPLATPVPILGVYYKWNLTKGNFLCLLTYFCYLKGKSQMDYRSDIKNSHFGKCVHKLSVEITVLTVALGNGWLFLCPKQKQEKCTNVKRQTTSWKALLTTQSQKRFNILVVQKTLESCVF